MDSQMLALKPRVSEQTYAMAENSNVYVFNVPQESTKQSVKAAVEKQFKVSVTKVNIAVGKGKAKKSYQKRRQPIDGKRANYKKAYVSVKSGDKSPIYEEVN